MLLMTSTPRAPGVAQASLPPLVSAITGAFADVEHDALLAVLAAKVVADRRCCLLYTSPSPRDS